MAKTSQIFVYLLIAVVITLVNVSYCKIYSRRQDVEHFKTIQLDDRVDVSSVLRRLRRDTTSAPKPITIENLLGDKDEGYNEAIVHWSGEESKAIFVLTRQHFANGTVSKSKVWRSVDYGAQFSTITFHDANAVINYFYTSPTNKTKLVFTDVAHRCLYITKDEGMTFDVHTKLPFAPDKLLFHPTRDEWVLGYSFDDQKLYMSFDMGASWDGGHSHVNPRFFWAVPGVDAYDYLVHLETEDLENGGGYKYEAISVDESKGNSIKNYPQIDGIDIDSLLVQDEYIFVQKTTPFDSHLYVSYKHGPFQRAFFPMEAHPQDYSIVSTDQKQVFIAADHTEQAVHLYLSDPSGQFYVQSLSSLVALRRSRGGFDADLHEVRGMNGTYIANQLTGGVPRTYITFDEGGEWSLIPAPQKDEDGKPITCDLPDCSLHLHLSFGATMYNIPYILSEDNAPGLIMAQGLIGKQLNSLRSTLFISSDGGHTWIASLSGEYTHNIVDQGGAMVAVSAANQRKASSVLVSSNHGASWAEYQFTESDLVVDGVLNEPDINTAVVSIYGHDATHGSWTIVKLDFKPVMGDQCADADYEYWTPTDQLSTEGCLLGRKVTFRRRKASAQCFNGRDYEQAVNTTTCRCEEDDYECDFGYKQKDSPMSECVKEPWFDPQNPSWDCPENSNYNISTGHRRVPASRCEGGDVDKKYTPKQGICPLRAPEGLGVYSTAHQVAAVGKPVTFHISQEKGSKNSTNYTWNCGDSTTNHSQKGYDAAAAFTCTYHSVGKFTVTVTAINAATKHPVGTTTRILVEEEVTGVEVTEPHGAQIGVRVQFRLDVIYADHGDTAGSGFVHHVWMFGDEDVDQMPLLTYDSEVSHTFAEPGNYTCSVQTINAVGSTYLVFSAVVYGTLTTVQLTFTSNLINPLVHSVEWRELLAVAVRDHLMKELSVDHRRLEVVMLDISPQTADVSILPRKQTSTEDTTIDELVTALLLKAQGSLSIPLDSTVFGRDLVLQVTDARVLVPDTGKKSDYTAVYVCVPILMLAAFFIVLIALHYRKKFRSLRSTRYSVLHSRSASAAGAGSAQGPDGLLEDDDDDDPLLEPDMHHQPSRLAMSPADDDDDDDPLGVVVAGRSHGIGIQI